MSNRRGGGKIVSRTELAEFFGVSGPTVDHWVRTGCPVLQKGSRGVAWQFSTSDVYDWRQEKVRDEALGNTQADEFELKLRKLAAETGKAELEFAKAKSEVAYIADFEKALSRVFAEVKVSLRNVPSRVSPMLIGETNETRFKSVLLDEIDQALDALADSDLIELSDLEESDVE